MRRAARAGALASLLAAPTAIAFFSGGFFDRPRLIAAIAAWALVIAAALLVERPLPRSRAGTAALAGLALLCGWSALSFAWSPLADRTLDDVQRLLLYLAYTSAAVAFLRPTLARRAVEPALAAGALVVVGYGLSERLLPWLVELHRSPGAGGRLAQPLTYWNAMGALAALGVILCARIAGDTSRPRGLRAAAAAASAPLAAGAYLSFSRGAIATVAVGAVALLLLAPDGRSQLRAVAVVLGCGLGVSALVELLPAVASLQAGEDGDSAQGAAMLAGLLALGGLAAWLVARSDADTGATGPLGSARQRRQAAVALVAVSAAVVVGVAALERSPESPRFGATAARLSTTSSQRYEYWGVALGTFADHPIAGAGAGSFAVEWRRRRDVDTRALDAHSLYLETAAELGLAGLLFLALFLAGVAGCAGRLVRLDPAAAAGPVAAMLAWAVHAGLDWDWEMPGLTLVALALAAAMIAGSEVAPRAGRTAAG
jgi:O-antigen ligase/polysaccharide polymerase Wzy-like membrane protein